MKKLAVATLIGMLPSCTLTQNLKIKNTSDESVAIRDHSGMLRWNLKPQESIPYPAATVRTRGVSTGVVEFSRQTSKIKDSVRINGRVYDFPDDYRSEMRQWCDSSWLYQLFYISPATLEIGGGDVMLFKKATRREELKPTGRE